MVDSTFWQWLQASLVSFLCFYFHSFQKLKPWMRLFELGMLCFKTPNTGPWENVKALALWSSEVFTRQKLDLTAERELVQGYLEVSELLFLWKDSKSCFRALFPKLCLEGYWTESSSLANLRWPSSLATKHIGLTACCFSTDTHLTCFSWVASIFPEAQRSIFLLSSCHTLMQCSRQYEPARNVSTVTMEKC